jgi:hypothetical protein
MDDYLSALRSALSAGDKIAGLQYYPGNFSNIWPVRKPGWIDIISQENVASQEEFLRHLCRYADTASVSVMGVVHKRQDRKAMSNLLSSWLTGQISTKRPLLILTNHPNPSEWLKGYKTGVDYICLNGITQTSKNVADIVVSTLTS